MEVIKSLFLQRAWKVALIFKFLDGILNVVAAFFVMFLSLESQMKFIDFLTQNELTEDPQDFVANYLFHFSQNITFDIEKFIIAYLFIHGLVNIFMVSALWVKKMWLHRVAGGLLSIFLLYEVYRFFLHPSWVLFVFVVIDVFILFLLWKDLKK